MKSTFETLIDGLTPKHKLALSWFQNNKNNEFKGWVPVLENDTQNIIQYVEEASSKKKKFNFWKLLNVDE